MLNSAQAHDLPHGSHALIDWMNVLGLAKILTDCRKYVGNDRDPLAMGLGSCSAHCADRILHNHNMVG
jgi:hypothetical protein